MVSTLSSTQDMNALHELYRTQNELNRNLTRLSTAQRINQAADDAAGLAMSSRMDARVTGFYQYERNAQDALGFTEVADSALDGATDLLARADELAIRAANDTLSSDERAILNHELDGIKAELNDLDSGAEINGRALFGQSFDFAVQEGGPVSLDLEPVDAASLGLNGTTLTTAADARSAMSALHEAFGTTLERRADLGSTAHQLRSSSERAGAQAIQVETAASRIRDTDFAGEAGALSQNQIKAYAGAAALGTSQDMMRSTLALI